MEWILCLIELFFSPHALPIMQYPGQRGRAHFLRAALLRQGPLLPAGGPPHRDRRTSAPHRGGMRQLRLRLHAGPQAARQRHGWDVSYASCRSAPTTRLPASLCASSQRGGRRAGTRGRRDLPLFILILQRVPHSFVFSLKERERFPFWHLSAWMSGYYVDLYSCNVSCNQFLSQIALIH